MHDLISRQAAIDAVCEHCEYFNNEKVIQRIKEIPSVHVQPEKDAYMKAVYTWLLDYQIKAAELKGRYTPYEVLSWVVNDWRKEHE